MLISSNSFKLCYSIRNLILFVCMQVETLFYDHQDLLEEFKVFLPNQIGGNTIL